MGAEERVGEHGENRLSGGSFSETVPLDRGRDKDYLNLWVADLGFSGECTPLIRARMLVISHEHEKEYQALLDMTS